MAKTSSPEELDLFATQQSNSESEKWTIIGALDRIFDNSKNSKFSDTFLACSEGPLRFLHETLGLSNSQSALIAVLMEAGTIVSWRFISRHFGCNCITMMTHSQEMQELIEKRWVVANEMHEMGKSTQGYCLAAGVVEALCKNKTFVPEKLDGMDEQSFVERLAYYIKKRENYGHIPYKDVFNWMIQLVKSNPEIPICRKTLELNDSEFSQAFLLFMVSDYAEFGESPQEGMCLETLDTYCPDDWDYQELRKKLRSGKHSLMKEGLVEFKCEDGIANNQHYVFTTKGKEEFFSHYEPTKSTPRCDIMSGVKKHTSISEKPMFYNCEEHEQLSRLKELLSGDNLQNVQERLAEQGMRKGFTCLFYGGPGTGKTETALQLARATGRDIMEVNIAGMRDKYVGESEKNIKAVFSRYRKACESSEVMPILFFNEADALINKRTENLTSSVDKMNNAMQNIILQEMENLEGILIATTNLTQNLDSAFERRFLFKIEFKKPSEEIRTSIWQHMMKDLNDEDAELLASRFDFSGGQIENIARKQIINYALSGEKPSIEEIEKYCMAEQLNKRGTNSIGFRN